MERLETKSVLLEKLKHGDKFMRNGECWVALEFNDNHPLRRRVRRVNETQPQDWPSNVTVDVCVKTPVGELGVGERFVPLHYAESAADAATNDRFIRAVLVLAGRFEGVRYLDSHDDVARFAAPHWFVVRLIETDAQGRVELGTVATGSFFSRYVGEGGRRHRYKVIHRGDFRVKVRKVKPSGDLAGPTSLKATILVFADATTKADAEPEPEPRVTVPLASIKVGGEFRYQERDYKRVALHPTEVENGVSVQVKELCKSDLCTAFYLFETTEVQATALHIKPGPEYKERAVLCELEKGQKFCPYGPHVYEVIEVGRSAQHRVAVRVEGGRLGAEKWHPNTSVLIKPERQGTAPTVEPTPEPRNPARAEIQALPAVMTALTFVVPVHTIKNHARFKWNGYEYEREDDPAISGRTLAASEPVRARGIGTEGEERGAAIGHTFYLDGDAEVELVKEDEEGPTVLRQVRLSTIKNGGEFIRRSLSFERADHPGCTDMDHRADPVRVRQTGLTPETQTPAFYVPSDTIVSIREPALGPVPTPDRASVCAGCRRLEGECEGAYLSCVYREKSVGAVQGREYDDTLMQHVRDTSKKPAERPYPDDVAEIGAPAPGAQVEGLKNGGVSWRT